LVAYLMQPPFKCFGVNIVISWDTFFLFALMYIH
jgi:hypothetical protein